MSDPLPPPPDFSSTPAPGADPAHLPPPPAVEIPPDEVHESDVLKRRTHFSWKQFGGEGFLVSLGFHLLLLLAGLFWVISKYREPEKKPEEVFASGAGGGNKGDKAMVAEHKMKRPNMQVKMPSRIVSKSANSAVSLPSTPSTSSASFASGLSAGGLSKGSGGGSGGGEGTGIGIGKGGGRNFVSAFGASNLSSGFVGTYYDVKYARQPDADGKLAPSDLWQPAPTWHSYDNIKYDVAFPGKGTGKEPDADRYYKLLNDIGEGKAAEDVLAKYFVSPTKLTASQMWIASTSSSKSPEAFSVGDKCGPHYWVVSYRAKISPPSSGRWRFVGQGDDVMIFKINGKPALAWYWWLNKPYLKHVWQGAPRGKDKGDLTKVRKYDGAVHGNPAGAGVSAWQDLKKGTWYDCEIVIGDWGGKFSGFLLCEKEGEKYEDVGGLPKIPIFRTSDEMEAKPGDSLPPFAENGPIWSTKPPDAIKARVR